MRDYETLSDENKLIIANANNLKNIYFHRDKSAHAVSKTKGSYNSKT